MKQVALILLMIATVSSSFAQHSKKAVKAYESAESAFMKHDYKTAHQQALKAITTDPNYAEAWLLEGEIGMETEDFVLAMIGYENALAIDSMLFPPAAITLARLYDRQGSYKRELALLNWYRDAVKGNTTNDAVVNEMLELASFRDYAVSHPVAFQPESLGDKVNTQADEYVNMLQFDGSQLLFTRKVTMDEGFQRRFY